MRKGKLLNNTNWRKRGKKLLRERSGLEVTPYISKTKQEGGSA